MLLYLGTSGITWSKMVRTKAEIATSRVPVAKAPRKTPFIPGVANDKGSRSREGSGGNPYHTRETPEWQKEITRFFTPMQRKEDKINESTSSEAKDPVHMIHSSEPKKQEHDAACNVIQKTNDQIESDSENTDTRGHGDVDESA